MKIKILILIIIALGLSFWFYKNTILGITYEKGVLINLPLEKLNEDIATNKAKYEGKRIMFEGYLGYSNSTFSINNNEKNTKGIFDSKVYTIGVYNSIIEIEDERVSIEILLPKTGGANGFEIEKKMGSFTNNEVTYTTNKKEKINYKNKVFISADVIYYCINNFNTNSKNCDSENPINKKRFLFYQLKNIRIDKN